MIHESDVALAKWSAVQSHLNSIYHQPDLDALEIICTSIAAHNQLSSKPIWPIIIGPPSTGKTEICIAPFAFLKNSHPVGDLTPKSFMPGTGTKEGSFLRDSGPSAIWLVKDLGTLLSKREHDAKEIFAILRDVFDGEVSRRAGGVKIPIWKGKITLIAASTTFLDRAYDFVNELGDRFIFVRWRRGDGIAQGIKAIRQVRRERDISGKTSALLHDFMGDGLKVAPPDLPEELEERIVYLAEATARLRTRVVRDRHSSSRDIIDIPEAEGPGRLVKAMAMLTTFRAALFGKEKADNDDVKLARRISAESVPSNRMRFISAMKVGDNEWDDVRKRSGLPRSSVNWVAEELVALEIIERFEGGSVYFKFTAEFEKIWTIANIPT